jgi:formate hydrogenlyase subunit 3/multisubunit Na+/H+ antiporter MnhD subunit
MVYNLTNVSFMTNQSGLLGATQAVNDNLMGGWLGSLFLIGIAVVIFMALLYSTNDVKRSITATSFLSFGLALFLRAVNLIPDMAIYMTLIACACSLAFSWKKG